MKTNMSLADFADVVAKEKKIPLEDAQRRVMSLAQPNNASEVVEREVGRNAEAASRAIAESAMLKIANSLRTIADALASLDKDCTSAQADEALMRAAQVGRGNRQLSSGLITMARRIAG